MLRNAENVTPWAALAVPDPRTYSLLGELARGDELQALHPGRHWQGQLCDGTGDPAIPTLLVNANSLLWKMWSFLVDLPMKHCDFP